MFGIQLDTVKKIELGFCVVVLALAGYFFFASSRAVSDSTVSAWTEVHYRGADGRPASATNPEDPTKSYQITYFWGVDGKLEVTEWPKRNDGTRAAIHFSFDKNKKKYEAFESPMQVAEAVSDETKRALTMAAVSQIFDKKPWGLFGRLGLDTATQGAISSTYKTMQDSIELYDNDATRGMVEKDQYEKVMKAMDEFRNSGAADVKENPKKQQAAKKVMTAGMDFYKMMQDEKLKKISAWVDDTIPKLNDDQKKRAVEVATRQAAASTRPAGGGGGGRIGGGGGGGAGRPGGTGGGAGPTTRRGGG